MQRGLHLAQTQVVSHWFILMKTLVHQFVNIWQLVRPDYGVGDVLLVPGGLGRAKNDQLGFASLTRVFCHSMRSGKPKNTKRNSER